MNQNEEEKADLAGANPSPGQAFDRSNKLVAQTQLAKLRLGLSRLGLGTAPLGGLYSNISETQAIETIQFALSYGINVIDTAPYYGAGLSEQRVGMALRDFPRSSYVLSTKVGRIIHPDGTSHFDFSRTGILRSVEASLQRLNLDRIDFLFLHDPDEHYVQALQEAVPVLMELRRERVVNAIGVGMNQWEMLAKFAQEADFDCFLLAGRYTLLEQEADQFLSSCYSRQISIFLGGVYNSGILATGAVTGAKYNYQEAPFNILEKVKAIETVCLRYDVPLNVAALRFVLGHQGVTTAVIGAQSIDEVKASIAALHYPIPHSLWTELKTVGLLKN